MSLIKLASQQDDKGLRYNEDLVLATMVISCDPKCWEVATALDLSIADFRFSDAKAVFSAMKDLASEGHYPLNFLAIFDRLNQSQQAYLNENLTSGSWDNFAMSSALPSYIRLMRDKNNEMLVMDIILANGTSNPAMVSRKIEEALIKSAPAGTLDHTTSLAELFAEYENLATSGIIGIQSGFRDLDAKIYGFRAGEVYIIAARPSMGKSAFATNIAINLLKKGHGVYIQALEETKKGILKRMTANIGGVQMNSLMTGKFKADEWSKVAKAQNIIKDFNLMIDDTSGLTGDKIAVRIKHAAKQFKLDCVIVDHLQEVVGDSRESRHHQISRALGELKTVAKELQIPMIVLSQINRGTENRDVKFPTMADLKESGDIEAKADCVMLLYRQDYYESQKPSDQRKAPDNLLIISIAKNRNGMTGAVKLHFDGGMMRVDGLI